MRLFLILVSLIAVHTVDSRDLTFPGVQISEDGNILLDVSKEIDPADGVNDIAERGVERELKRRSLSGFEITQHLNAVDDVHELNKGDQTESANAPRRLRCKARNACVVMGGFCVTNASHCSGRVVPEGCKGLNCQCCVPGTLELEIRNLERKLNSMNNSLTSENSKILMELNSMKNNLTHDNSAINSELHSMKHKLTSDNTEIKLELSSIKHNLTSGNSAIKTQLHSMKTKLIDDNLEMKTDLQTLKHNLTDNKIQINSELSAVEDNIIAAIGETGCKDGMFYFPGTHQCFKFINQQLSWTSANSKCQQEGLVLAQPLDPVSLRAYIVSRYDPSDYCWLGARGDGTYIRWLRGNQIISSSSSLWKPTSPSTRVTTNDYLFLLTSQSYVDSYPTKPYFSNKGTYTHYPLCEKVLD